jgi:hypothetical protein
MTGMNTHKSRGKSKNEEKKTDNQDKKRRGGEGIVEIEKGFGNFFGNFPQEIILGR